MASIAASLYGCRANPAAARQAFMASGNQYAAAGKYPEAIIEYRNAIQQDPRDGTAHEKLADVSLEAGDVAGATREYVRAADLAADDVTLELKAGNLLLVAGQFEAAKARAARILAKDGRSVDAQILMANALAGLKNVDAAIQQIEDALDIDPARSSTYSNLGALELSQGKRDEAERAFRKAIEIAPRSFAAHLALGNFYWTTDQTAAAESSFKRALAIDPRNALTNRVLANFYLATHRMADAEGPLRVVADVAKTPGALFALSGYYISMKNEAAARQILSPMAGDPKTAATANVWLAALDYKGGNAGEALKRLNAVLDKDQTNLQALLLKGAVLLADGKPDEALESVNAAAERNPRSTAAMFMLGRVQTARKQPAAAIHAFEETLRLNPLATAAKVALARLYLAQGQPETSMGLAAEAMSNEPKNGEAQLVYARGLLRQGEVDRASAELTQLVQRFPASGEVHTAMGMLLGQQHQRDAARAEFQRALQLQPENVEALGGLVALDLAARDFAGARALVDAKLAAAPAAPLLALAARTYAAGGDLDAAKRFLQKAVEVDPSDLAAYRALGQLYLKQGKLPEARAEFQKMAVRSPKSVGALTMLAIIDQAQGDRQAARSGFEHVLQVDPEAAVAANNLAWIYADEGGNLDVALQLAQTARRHLPALAEVNDTLGFIYYKKDLAALAIPALKISVEKEPANAVYQYHLGLAYNLAGDALRTRQSLSRALALKPDFAGAPQARELLASLQK